MYDSTFEENNIITISLSPSVKKKICEKFESEIETFIETEFPQDKELEVYMFKYMRGDDAKLALKVKNSDYMLLMERSIDKYTNQNDNYMFCFDIQKRPEIIKDGHNEFIEKKCELKIPIEFNRKYYNRSTVELLENIERQFKYIEPYKTPSLSENEEFKKWYAYLTLLEKLIDEKDFYFEANIRYTDKKAKVDISNIKNKTLLEKIKKARNQSFFYYQADEVDTKKPLHEWDEKDNRNRNFGDLKQNKSNEISFDLDDEFIKKFTSDKHLDNYEIISSSFDTNDFIVKARQYLESSIKSVGHNVVFKDKLKTKINTANSIKNMKISKNEEKKLLDIWNKLSAKHHDENAQEIEKEYINETLEILKNLLPNKQSNKSFNPPSKLILRVSYFRDQFQLKTLKIGLEQIQRHPLKVYLFGDKKIAKIEDEDVNSLEIEYLSKILNEKQKEAIKKALLSQHIFMIQGPPGTGKTEVISELAYQEAIRGKKVLIVSQANMAVDNAIQRLSHPSLYPVRIIRKDYKPEDVDSLPIEANIGSFYQNRIIRTLSDELDKECDEKENLETFLTKNEYDEKFIDIASKIGINIPPHLDLSDDNDKEDFTRILTNKSNREILEKRLKYLKRKEHFNSIQNDFLDDMRDDDRQDIEKEKKAYLADSYIKNVNIWGATLFETGKKSFKDMRFDVVIVDEVSKAMPPELVLPILKGEKLILVGDHKQLPPIIKNVSLEDLANETGISADSLDFETTVFEKLIMNNPDSYVMLNKQYRMHPDIQRAINQFYVDDKNQGGLECGLTNPNLDKCHKIQDEAFKNKHLIWLKTKASDKDEQMQGSTSYFNTAEISGIEKTLGFLDREYQKIRKIPTVGVITFYGKQLGELTELEKKEFWKLPQENKNYPNLDLRFGTVDRFQGQEKDIIIVSLVRNNKDHNVGFAKKPNRVNVAFSRAKKLLIIVGNVDNFTFGKNEKSTKMYKEVFNVAKKLGTVQGI